MMMSIVYPAGIHNCKIKLQAAFWSHRKQTKKPQGLIGEFSLLIPSVRSSVFLSRILYSFVTPWTTALIPYDPYFEL